LRSWLRAVVSGALPETAHGWVAMRMPTPVRCAMCFVVVELLLGNPLSTARATLADHFGPRLAPLAQAFARTVARSLPSIAASAGLSYTFDVESGTFRREAPLVGQLLLEHADPIGAGRRNLSLSYERVVFDSFEGQRLGDLEDRRPVIARDGQPLFALPHTRIDAEAQAVNVSATYGLTERFDVNLTVPVVYTALSRTDRVETFFPPAETFTAHAAASKLGVGDVLLRSKYALVQTDPLHLAGGLGVRLPSGRADDFQGTGDVEFLPMLYASSRQWERGRIQFQGHLNTGADIDAQNVDAGEGRWSAGLDAGIGQSARLAVAVLGRHGFGRIAPRDFLEFRRCLDRRQRCLDDPLSAKKGPAPLFGLRGDRADYYDLSVGGRLVLWRDTIIGFANVLVPLNESGLRSEPIPLVGLEAAF